MGGSQARPISSKNVQSYKSAVGVEHKPEKTIFDKIMDSGESYNDAPYSYNDTQEEKLRKVREELFRRIDSHTHAEMAQLISTVSAHMDALSSKVELLEITVKAQAALIEQFKTSSIYFVKQKQQSDTKEKPKKEFITIYTVGNRLEKLGVVVDLKDIVNFLIGQKYLSKGYNKEVHTTTVTICKDTEGWDKIINENASVSTQGIGRFMISQSYTNNVLIPYFKKRQEALDNLDNQFKNNGGV